MHDPHDPPTPDAGELATLFLTASAGGPVESADRGRDEDGDPEEKGG